VTGRDNVRLPMPVVLSPRERSTLRARAHHLKPVVRVGLAGLSAAFIAEVDRALSDHELIKVRVDLEDRDARASVAEALSTRTDSAVVQQLGKTLVLWRPKPVDAD
jgi:RNA-binding protein